MKRWIAVISLCAMLTGCGNAAMSGAVESDYKPTLDVLVDISGNDVKVTVKTDLNISEEHFGGARKAGEGHIHMYLDDQEKISVKEDEKLFSDLEPGLHKLRVSLHNNDHTPYDVTKTVEFDIE